MCAVCMSVCMSVCLFPVLSDVCVHTWGCEYVCVCMCVLCPEHTSTLAGAYHSVVQSALDGRESRGGGGGGESPHRKDVVGAGLENSRVSRIECVYVRNTHHTHYTQRTIHAHTHAHTQHTQHTTHDTHTYTRNTQQHTTQHIQHTTHNVQHTTHTTLQHLHHIITSGMRKILSVAHLELIDLHVTGQRGLAHERIVCAKTSVRGCMMQALAQVCM